MTNDCQEFQNNGNGDPKINVTKDDNYLGAIIVESTYRSILDELFDDAVLDVCFEVHKAEKINNFLVELSERGVMECPEEREELIPLGKKSKATPMPCLFCKKIILDVNNYTTHAAYCTGTKKRAVKENLKELDSEQYASKKKGYTSTKSSITSINYQEKTYDELKELLDQKCGVISKRTQKLCMKSHNCPIHPEEQRREVRLQLLGVPNNQIKDDDGKIEVETLDVENVIGGNMILPLHAGDESMPVVPGNTERNASGYIYEGMLLSKRKTKDI